MSMERRNFAESRPVPPPSIEGNTARISRDAQKSTARRSLSREQVAKLNKQTKPAKGAD